MVINVTDQICISPALPLKRQATFVNSSLGITVVGVPDAREDGTVTGVTVVLVNADETELTAPCTKGLDGNWRTAFSANCFPSYGFISKGVKVSLALDDNGTPRTSTVAVGDFEVLADSASSTPGDPNSHYQQKGGDIYLKSNIVDGIQHYKKQELLYDDDMAAWGLDWTGDYILSNGDFVPYQP